MHHLARVRSRAIILHEGKLLLVKNSRGSDYYALPGGHVDPGETPKECIARELVEELGVTPEVGRLAFIYTFQNSEGEQSVEFFFEVTNGADFVTHESQIKTHAHELSEVRWVTPHEEVRMLPHEIHTRFKGGTPIPQTVEFLKG